MEYPLSPIAAEFLISARKKGMFESAIICMDLELSEISESDKILLALTRINDSLKGHDRAVYLCESTISRGDNLENEAEGHLKVGYPARGRRLSINAPIDWGSFESEPRNIRYKVQSLLACDGILFADSTKPSNRWYKPGLKFVRDWVSNYIVKDREDDYSWYDMAVGQRATKLSYILRRAIENEEDYRYIAPMIVAADIHIQDLMYEEKIAMHSNHGLFQMLGLLSLGKLLPFMKRSKEAVDFATRKIIQMFELQFSEDGLHREHSPIYHIYMTNFIYTLQKSGFLQDNDRFEEIAKRALESASWMIQPDKTILPFGDSPPDDVRRRANFPLNLANGLPSPPFGFKNFKKSGLVICSSPGISGEPSEYFAIAGSFFSRQHKHADDLGFQLFSGGKGILTDAGTFSYQYDNPERIFIESTRAHNCLEIDGHDYSRFRIDAFGNCIDIAEMLGDAIFVDATINRTRLVPSHLPYNKVKGSDCISVQIKQRRIAYYVPGKFLVIVDVVKSKNERTFTQWFNLFPGLQFSNNEGDWLISDNEEVLAVIRNLSGDPIEVVQRKGQEEPRLEGWISPNGHTLQETHSLGIRKRGTEELIATMIDVDFGLTNKVTLNRGSGGMYNRITVSREDGVFDLKIRNKGDRVNIEHSSSEGKTELTFSIFD